MSVQANPFPVRLDKSCMDKIRVLAAENKRSVNMQISFAVEKYLEAYEKEHGEISVPEEV